MRGGYSYLRFFFFPGVCVCRYVPADHDLKIDIIPPKIAACMSEQTTQTQDRSVVAAAAEDGGEGGGDGDEGLVVTAEMVREWRRVHVMGDPNPNPVWSSKQ